MKNPYLFAALKDLPTISTSHAFFLKLDTGTVRVYIPHIQIGDAPPDDIIVMKLNKHNRWVSGNMDDLNEAWQWYMQARAAEVK